MIQFLRHVVRGGSCYYWSAFTRASYRRRSVLSARFENLGVRCAQGSR